MEKHEGKLVFYWCCFVIGLTIGSIAALGSGKAEPELCESVEPWRYVLTAFVTSLPFLCCVFLPCTAARRAMAGSAAVGLKGFVLGFAAVYIFSETERKLYFYAVNILPQLLIDAPLLIDLLALVPIKSKTSLPVRLVLAAAVSLLAACARLLLFLALSHLA